MALTWDDATREQYKTAAQLVISVVIGAIVALPSISGLLKPPLVFAWGVFAVLALGALSLLMLGVVIGAVMIKADKPPLKLIGLGSWTAVAALGLLLFYLLVNLFDDLTSPPVIHALKASPARIAPQSSVELDVEALEQAGRRLDYVWTFNDVEFSRRRNAYFKAPDKPGVYVVSVAVSAGDRTTRASQSIEVVAEKTVETPIPSYPPIVQICNPEVKDGKTTRKKKPTGAGAARTYQC